MKQKPKRSKSEACRSILSNEKKTWLFGLYRDYVAGVVLMRVLRGSFRILDVTGYM